MACAHTSRLPVHTETIFKLLVNKADTWMWAMTATAHTTGMSLVQICKKKLYNKLGKISYVQYSIWIWDLLNERPFSAVPSTQRSIFIQRLNSIECIPHDFLASVFLHFVLYFGGYLHWYNKICWRTQTPTESSFGITTWTVYNYFFMWLLFDFLTVLVQYLN